MTSAVTDVRAICRAGQMRWIAAAVVVIAAVVGPTSFAEGRGPVRGPVYFWTNIAGVINRQNPLAVKPSTFLMFEDGQWVLEHMRWTGWGSPVAHGSGVSSSSNDIPNAAQGKRITTWARVTLSDPGRFQGHEVYRCFSLAVPGPASAGPQPMCLTRSGGIWLLRSRAPARRSARAASAISASRLRKVG